MKRKTKVAITTLGCAKNFVDSQSLAREIRSAGAEFVSQPGRADVLVVNTCGFTGDAREESVNTLLEAIQWKEHKPGRRVMAMGCFTQRDGDEIAEEIPELDGVFGIGEWTTMLDALELNPLKRNGSFASLSSPLSAGPGYAYLRISDGCSMGCSFCSIPQMRGYLHSEPMEKLIAEAKTLAEAGARELILIGQEITSYGADIYGQRMLPELLWRLSEILNIQWLRLLYFHPPSTTPKFLEEIMRVPKVCSYLDFPIEHASNKILKAMNRRTSRERMRETIDAFRTMRADACVRTSVMVGFPSESPEVFDELYRFMEDVQFERAGAFVYSPEPGTPAAELPNSIEQGIALDRLDKIMKLQRRICRRKHERFIGRTVDVLVERTRGARSWGRTKWDAPEIDAEVRIDSSAALGQIVPIKIRSASAYELRGVVGEI